MRGREPCRLVADIEIEGKHLATNFTELGLSEPVLRAIGELGFEEPTPIQEQCVGLLLQNRDVIAQAQTGTGKTAAFGLPMLERVLPGAPGPQGLVPTVSWPRAGARQISGARTLAIRKCFMSSSGIPCRTDPAHPYLFVPLRRQRRHN